MLIKQPFKVIVIDDDENICQMIELWLKKDEELTVKTFVDAEKGCNYLFENIPNIVLLDINLITAYGDQILRKIKRLKEGVSVVTMTAELNLITFQSCQNFGASQMLCKPITKNSLNDVIQNIKEDFSYWNSEYQKLISSRK
jgi:DNA-binding NtrC family response regulator